MSTVVARRALDAIGISLNGKELEERVEELQKRTEVEIESEFIKLTVAGDDPKTWMGGNSQ